MELETTKQLTQRQELDAPPRWYEFDWLYPYRDVVTFIGFLCVVVGVGILSIAVALIVAGIFFSALGVELGRS